MHGEQESKGRYNKELSTTEPNERVRKADSLVDLLHGRGGGGLVGGGLSSGSGCNLLVLVDVETESDHPVDALGEGRGLVEGETGSEKSSLEEEESQVADGLVGLVLLDLGGELLDDGVLGVELESLLRCHVRRHRGVTEGLCLHDTLHVGRPAELTSDQDARGVLDTVGDDDLLDAVTESLLYGRAELLVLGDLSLTLGLLLLGFLELETLLGDTDKLLAVELLELGDGVFVDGVDEEEDLEALLLEGLEEGGLLDGSKGLAGEVVDGLLNLGHAGDVVLEGGLLVDRLGGVEAKELGELAAVLGVLVNTELDVLAEGLVELGEVVLVLRDLGDEVESLLDEVLADDLEDLVLLESLTRDVEGEILRVDDTLDEVEVLGDEVLAIVHDEDTADVELDVVALLLGLEEIEGSTVEG